VTKKEQSNTYQRRLKMSCQLFMGLACLMLSKRNGSGLKETQTLACLLTNTVTSFLINELIYSQKEEEGNG
jgi:hypothetical protein